MNEEHLYKAIWVAIVFIGVGLGGGILLDGVARVISAIDQWKHGWEEDKKEG